MQITRRWGILRAFAAIVIAVYAFAGLARAFPVLAPYAPVLPVAFGLFLLWRLQLAMNRMNAARAAGESEAADAYRGAFRMYEAGCMVYGLVVMAVLLLPIVFHPHEHARQTTSLVNLKQLAFAVMQYSQDYNETFPGWVQNPDGAYVHNVWDQQIDSQVKTESVFMNGDRGIRSYSDPQHERVLTYGLNGLLITPPKAAFDGNAGFDVVSPKSPPHPLAPGDIQSPGTTILFAELSTISRFPGEHGVPPSPRLSTWKDGPGSERWRHAWDGWIDISPRAWVENGGPQGSYYAPYADHATEYGVMRLNYRQMPMACFAFADGHAKVMRLSHTVGLGATTSKGLKITEYNCWSPENTNNMWIPRQAKR